MKVTVTAPQFNINLNDVVKGLKMAVILPVLTIIYTSLSSGSFLFDWHAIGVAAALGFVGYLIKNFFDKPQVVVSDASPATIEAVKEGAPVQMNNTTTAVKQ